MLLMINCIKNKYHDQGCVKSWNLNKKILRRYTCDCSSKYLQLSECLLFRDVKVGSSIINCKPPKSGLKAIKLPARKIKIIIYSNKHEQQNSVIQKRNVQLFILLNWINSPNSEFSAYSHHIGHIHTHPGAKHVYGISSVDECVANTYLYSDMLI